MSHGENWDVNSAISAGQPEILNHQQYSVTAAFIDADPQRAPSLLAARQLQKPGRRSSKVPHG